MNTQKYKAEIFDILSKGQFICSNSSDDDICSLYKFIEEDDNFNKLYEYFEEINFFLEKADEYYYFSRKETKAHLERKLEMAFKWIDLVDFLKTFDNSFSPGLRFSPSEIIVRLKTDADLKAKLEGLKKYALDKLNYSDILVKNLDLFVKANFIELEDKNTDTYKVLSSFKYLEQLILSINISEKVINEIPE